ncbi:hypothetical protein E8E12_009162 [Didymella heteroderae]|uniref:Uncharacterized protein n=1 Tax=Didymella heteroderae TaxID=1769908 RepID=A0A9P5C192_9PLEO|nr:hypothetical protein E8E12_009162 [Didymella heteroderae]
MEVTKSEMAASDAVHNVDATSQTGTEMTTLRENEVEEIAPIATHTESQARPKSLDEPFKAKDTVTEADAKPGQYTSEKPVMVTRLDRLGEEPALIDCPFCKECRQTRILQVAHKPHEGKVEVKLPEDKTKEMSMYAKPGQEVSKYAKPTKEAKSYALPSVQWERNQAAKAAKAQAT